MTTGGGGMIAAWLVVFIVLAATMTVESAASTPAEGRPQPLGGRVGTTGPAAVGSRAVDVVAVVDTWLTGDGAPVIELGRLPADEVRAQVAHALNAWGAGDEDAPAYPTAPAPGMEPDRSLDERRRAVRRTQALAAVAMEVLLEGQVSRAETTAWEDATRAAAARLRRVTQVHLPQPDDRRRLAHFQAWWIVAYLQFLHEARRTDFDAAVSRATLDQADADVRAEFYAIRGLRAEYMSRLAPSRGPVRVEAIGGDPVTPRMQADRGPWIRRWLATADGLFAEALRREPAHDEARLHWGRVALERGRPDEAVERLAPLVRIPCADALCGLASLFTGEAHEQQGRLPEADRAYALSSSASSVRPHALVALMQLGVRRGESSGTALTRHLEAGTAAPPTGTAWSAYLNGRRLVPGAVIARLRAAVVAPTRIGG